MKIFSIKDLKADTFSTPFFQPTDVHAVRMFKTEVNRAEPNNMLYLYPDEYELHYVGTFNTDSGAIDFVNNAKAICNGRQLVNKKEEPTNGR